MSCTKLTELKFAVLIELLIETLYEPKKGDSLNSKFGDSYMNNNVNSR